MPAVEPSDTVTVLERDGTTYYLVGTAHVSADSVAEVERVIEAVKPDTVCVELCEARYKALTNHSSWRDLDIFKVIKEGKTLFLLANIALSAHQRRIGAQLGVKPGSELLAAVKKAEQVGAKVELVDRDIHATLKRTWANLGFGSKAKLLAGLLIGGDGGEITEETIEELKTQAGLSEMLSEFADALPEVKEPLIDERDQYLISGIEAAAGPQVVAVVGAAHVPGMKENFGKPIDRAKLAELPPPSKFLRVIKWVIPLAILAAFSVGLIRNEGKDFSEMLFAWILPNSIMCALLTTLAGGKPLSIITGFVASPITSLNPLLGAGMVVGLVEAWLRKPTVADCETVADDVSSVRGFYRNRVLRVLLVAVAATLGSALGAWVGLAGVLSRL